MSRKSHNRSLATGTAELPVEVAQVIQDLPPNKRRMIVQALAISKQHSGPLPDGDTLRVYNEVIPEGGDRLMKTVELQVNHRIDIEKYGVKRTFNQSATGQYMGFGIAIFFCLVSAFLIHDGHDLAGGVLGTVDLVALVTVFITSRGGKPTA